MDWKRIGLILGFIVLTFFLGFLIYWFFFRPTPPLATIPPPTETPPTVGLPPSGQFIPPTDTTGAAPSTPTTPATPDAPAPTATTALGGFIQTNEVTIERTEHPTLASNGRDIVSLSPYDGMFYRITPDGQREALTDQTFHGAQYVEWGPQSDQAVIEFYDGSNILYNFATKQQVTLPAHWEDFSFSPTGQSISFKSMATDVDNRWFAISNNDGSNGVGLEKMGTKTGMFTSTWSPSDQIVGTYREGIDGDRQTLYLIGKNGENFKAITAPGRGLQTQWSTNGDRLLMSSYYAGSGYKPQLWIVDALGDAIGENRRDLGIQTWAEKCVFSDNTTLYCAVPRQLDYGAGILPVATDKGPDDLYMIDIASGSKVKLGAPQDYHTMENLVISEDKSMLYFSDKDTGRIYMIHL